MLRIQKQHGQALTLLTNGGGDPLRGAVQTL